MQMRKKVWINTGDIILIGLRSFQDTKADVIQKYTSDEARRLKSCGELPDNTEINKTDVCVFCFVKHMYFYLMYLLAYSHVKKDINNTFVD